MRQGLVDHVIMKMWNKLNVEKPQHPKGIVLTNQRNIMYNFNIKNSIWFTNGKEMQKTPTMVQIFQPPFHPHFVSN
jgi:hypothetical protein